MSFANNLKSLRKKCGMTQPDLAEKLGVTVQAISNWESGRAQPSVKNSKEVARVFGVPVDSLISDDPGMVPDGAIRIVTDEEAEIPVYGSIAAGVPIEMVPVDDVVAVSADVKRRWPRSFFLKVKGTSMDRILPDGCLALIDPCDGVDRPGQPYAVCVNGYDATIKRVNVLANGFELEPDSTDPTYKPVIFDYGEEGTEEITIIGRVVWYMPTYNWTF